MVDGPGSFDTQTPPAPTVEKPAGFLSGTTGKIVLGVVAFLVVLAIVGASAWFFLMNGSSSSSPTITSGVVVTTTNTASSTPAGSSTSQEPITNPAEKPLESTFTFRNVFAPTLKQQFPPIITPATVASASAAASAAVVPKIPADTLYLQSIQTVNGKTTATFLWNGASYTLSPGESIPDTPWQLLSIGTSSVVMLFGDTEVTLSTGQGLNK